MLKLKKVAVTGGLSCGKSTVCRILSELGAKVVDADAIVHQQLSTETPLGKKVIELLGSDIVTGKNIDRAKIAGKVFTHPKLLRSLEDLLHPAVYEEINRQYNEAKEKEKISLFVADVPLLFESGGDKEFNATVCVIANREKSWERFRKSTGYEREEYNRRMARQMNPHEKAEKSDYVIRNDGTLEELEENVKHVFKQLTPQ